METSKKLSKREQEVVKLLLEGKCNKHIASSLHITESTVEFHLKNIYARYQVGSRMELVLKLGKTPAGKLGESIVAEQRKIAENSGHLNGSNWASHLREAISIFSKELKMKVSATSDMHDGANMTFYDSIRACLTKYSDFEGRASRPEFWWFTLFIILVASALAYLDERLTNVFLIATLLPFLAAGARRLHDTNRSGWWQLFILAPIAGLVLVGILWAQSSVSPSSDAV